MTVTAAVYFMYFESIIIYMEAHAKQVVCLKRLTISVVGSSEPLHLLRLINVYVPSLRIVSIHSVIQNEDTTHMHR